MRINNKIHYIISVLNSRTTRYFHSFYKFSARLTVNKLFILILNSFYFLLFQLQNQNLTRNTWWITNSNFQKPLLIDGCKSGAVIWSSVFSDSWMYKKLVGFHFNKQYSHPISAHLLAKIKFVIESCQWESPDHVEN